MDPRFREQGQDPPVSTDAGEPMGTRTAMATRHHGTPAALRLSGLPYVSWDDSLTQEDEARALAIEYPDTQLKGFEQFLESASMLYDARRKAGKRLISQGVHEALGLSADEFARRMSTTDDRFPKHDGFHQLFFRTTWDETSLLSLAKITVPGELAAFKNLDMAGDAEVVYTNGGMGFIVNPRLVAWRIWLDYTNGQEVTRRHDYLMDLVSFAWYVLQNDVPHDRVVLGGSYVEQDGEKRILSAVRDSVTARWKVELWQKELGPAAVIIMT